MMDPITAFGLITAVVDLLERAYDYGKAVRDAHSDMAKLTSELLGLKGALKQIQRLVADKDTGNDGMRNILQTNEFRDTVQSAKEVVERLAEKLVRKQTFHQVAHALQWPWIKDKVAADIQTLERVKSWFVLMMMSENLTEMKLLLKDSSHILDIVKEEQKARIEADRLAKLTALKSILQPVDPGRLHRIACEKRLSTTGGWFLDGPVAQWKESHEKESKILWLHGRSGSGKSTLHASTVERLSPSESTAPKSGLAYFYCSFADSQSQVPANILGSILWQLCEQVPDTADKIASLKWESIPLIETLRDTILQCSNCFETLYVTVDAVNESSSSGLLLEHLFKLATTAPSIRLLVTSVSRPMTMLRQARSAAVLDVREVQMNEAGVAQDIESYIDSRLGQERILRLLRPDVQGKVRQSLMNNANMMSVPTSPTSNL